MNKQTLGVHELDALIKRSLARSAQYGVDPHCSGAPESSRLNARELGARIRSQKMFYDLGTKQLLSLFRLLRGTGFCMALADREGYVLFVIGDSSFLRHFKRRRCMPGYRWTEKDMGTCAIGLALAERIPVFLPGEKMYCVPARKLSNAGAPVFSPSGELLGVISLSGFSSKMHIHTLGLVRLAAETITAQWREARRINQLDANNQYLRALIDSDPRGIITVDTDGRIVETNSSARQLLALPDGCHHKFLREFAPDFAEIGAFLKKGAGFQSREFQGAGARVYVSMSPIQVDEKVVGALMALQEKKEVLRQAMNMTGVMPHFTFASIIGQHRLIKDALRIAGIASKNDAPVMLEGETGTGKELFAQAIHNAGSRGKGPFVAINCGAIPRELLESELFGYESGAFTGAQKGGRPGKIELADNGTLFLDEIGDLPFDMQVKLLRALQFGEIQRLGSISPVRINFRIIAATCVDMGLAITSGRFRADLFYRISTLRIEIPPLRKRGRDILELAEYFIKQHESRLALRHRKLPAQTRQMLLTYPWPGNIRQLENAVERAVYLSEGGELLPAHFGLPHPDESPNEDFKITGRQGLKEMEKNQILAMLEQTGGNISICAQKLGISRPTMYRKLRNYGINKKP